MREEKINHPRDTAMNSIHECWRCGNEGNEFQLPLHPDGGAEICDKCHRRIFRKTPAELAAEEAAIEKYLAEHASEFAAACAG